ncbi:hypothetical protein AcW1_003310 [Taiwanofungus camphoratus]|nr:hypothetical protein AcW1_003310 [Antrodia cinnamomea]
MYVERFRLLAEKAKLKDAFSGLNGQRTENDYPTLRAIFIKGLDQQIYTTLVGHTNTERPNSMEKWYTDVLHLDAVYKGIDQTLFSTMDIDYGEPMEVDALVTPCPTLFTKKWEDGDRRQALLGPAERPHLTLGP